MTRKRLDAAEIDAALVTLPGWKRVDGRNAIARSFVFKNFNEAFGWMTRVAMHSEKLDHHPEWFNVYRSVDVVLATHDAGGVTSLDITLARTMNSLILKGQEDQAVRS